MTDLSDIPTDWLEAQSVLVAQDRGDPDLGFADSIAAIYRMRDIEEREGRHFSAIPSEGMAELERRKDPDGSKRRAAEIEVLMRQRAEAEAMIADYRYPLHSLLRRLEKIDARLAELSPPAA